MVFKLHLFCQYPLPQHWARSCLIQCSTRINFWACIFFLCVASFSTVIEKHSVLHHLYAHDSPLQKSVPPHQIPDLLSMQKCIDDIKTMMTVNKLKLNDEKTEGMILSSGRKSRSLSSSFPDSMTIGSASVPMSDSVKILGVTLHCHLTIKTHISSPVRSTNFKLSCVSSIDHLLFIDATKIIVSAFVLSNLDYCNSLLSDCPQYLLNKLQKV